MATTQATSQATIQTRVFDLIRETLALEPTDSIKPTDLLFYDLDFTSIDLLDLLFRIEEEFGVEIPEGTLYRLAKGELDEETFCRDSKLTESGRKALMELLHDSPESIFPDDIHRQTLPRYATAAAFVRLVEAAQTDPSLISA